MDTATLFTFNQFHWIRQPRHHLNTGFFLPEKGDEAGEPAPPLDPLRPCTSAAVGVCAVENWASSGLPAPLPTMACMYPCTYASSCCALLTLPLPPPGDLEPASVAMTMRGPLSAMENPAARIAASLLSPPPAPRAPSPTLPDSAGAEAASGLGAWARGPLPTAAGPIDEPPAPMCMEPSGPSCRRSISAASPGSLLPEHARMASCMICRLWASSATALLYSWLSLLFLL